MKDCIIIKNAYYKYVFPYCSTGIKKNKSTERKAWRMFVTCPAVRTKTVHKYVTSIAENNTGIADYN